MRHVVAIFLTLTDGRIVLHRRDSYAKYNPGVLGFYAGSVEGDENYDAAMVRELKEETSLDVDALGLGYVGEFQLPDDPMDRDAIFHLYWAELPDADFEVYEGIGSEVYTLQDALNREDLAPPVDHALRNMLKVKK